MAALLTGGALINWRRSQDTRQVHSLIESHEYKVAEAEGTEGAAPLAVAVQDGSDKRMRLFWKMLRIPDNVAFRGKLFSRFLNMFPFVMEIWYWLLT